jgi:hypothetical protein
MADLLFEFGRMGTQPDAAKPVLTPMLIPLK